MRKIWAHTLVQNEENYIWYAVTSVIDYVDKVLIWDTGSIDNTVGIIEEIARKWPGKISFNEVGKVSPDKFTQVRNDMLKKTESDWFMILDGDEVWWEEKIKEISKIVNEKRNCDSIITKYVNLVGDIYHKLDEDAGKYNIKGRSGFLTIRAMNLRNIEGLSIERPHGKQGIVDGKGTLIQDRDEKNMFFTQGFGYMHFTNLERTSSREFDADVPKRSFKLKSEIGSELPFDFYYPESFFRPRPPSVRAPWKNMDPKFLLKASLQTPLRKIKRRLYNAKSGY